MHARLPHNAFERAGVILTQRRIIDIGRSVVTEFFGIVQRIVLDGGDRLQIGIVLAVALQAFDKAGTDRGGQIRVFAVGFLRTTPAGITGHVDGGRPVGQSFAHFQIVGTRFVRHDLGHFLHQITVPCLRNAVRSGERCCVARTRHAVQSLAPIAIGFNTQPRDRSGAVAQLRRFFLQGHAGYQIRCPLGKGVFAGRILINHLLCLLCCCGGWQHSHNSACAERQRRCQRQQFFAC